AGSGWLEGTLFPWVMTDFALMDAIECGIVKLPRVPVADNRADGEKVLYRNLWPEIRTRMPGGSLSCCRFRGHEDKIVTKELESGYDETEVQPRVQDRGGEAGDRAGC